MVIYGEDLTPRQYGDWLSRGISREFPSLALFAEEFEEGGGELAWGAGENGCVVAGEICRVDFVGHRIYRDAPQIGSCAGDRCGGVGCAVDDHQLVSGGVRHVNLVAPFIDADFIFE